MSLDIFSNELTHFVSRSVYESADYVYSFFAGDDGVSEDIIADFLGEQTTSFVPKKRTLLHQAISNLERFRIDQLTGSCPELCIEYFRSLLREVGSDSPDWLNENDVGDHIAELDRMLFPAVECLVPAIFSILFSDKIFLEIFQNRVSAMISEIMASNYPAYFAKDGVLRRCRRNPSWLGKAIFYRDKGKCQICGVDLTGLISPLAEVNLDHIIPLAKSGSNDPTNFQLSCKSCNSSKRDRIIPVKQHFVLYW